MNNVTTLNDTTSEIARTFDLSWPLLIAQLIPVILFILAARSILSRGRGWEVPVWLLLAFFIPVIFPIIALVHFRRSKFVPEATPTKAIV
jgi:hypothetical protein